MATNGRYFTAPGTVEATAGVPEKLAREDACGHIEAVALVDVPRQAYISPAEVRGMDRRAFLTGLGAVLAAPLVAEAQQARKVPRIGFLQRARNEHVGVFVQALREVGYVDGQNAVIETRIYERLLSRLPEFVNELVKLKCDVIVAAAPYAIRAAMKITSTIPIVGIDLESDPVASAWATSLNHPGRNLTGLFLDLPELGGKHIQLLRDTVPRLSRVGVLWDSAIGEVQFHGTATAGRSAGVAVESLPIQQGADLAAAFERAVRAQSNGVIVLSSPL